MGIHTRLLHDDERLLMHIELHKLCHIAFLVFAFLVFSQNILADCIPNGGTLNCDYEGEASAACVVSKALASSAHPENSYECEPKFGNTFFCHKVGNNYVSCLGPTGAYTYHSYTIEGDPPPECPTDSGYSWFGDANVCVDGCVYSADISTCIGNECLQDGHGTGAECSGEPIASPPDGCTLEGEVVVCDCVTNPSAPFCPGGDPGPDPDDCFEDAVSGSIQCYQPDDPNHPDPPETPFPGGGGDTGSGNPSNPLPPGTPGTDPVNPGDGDPNTPTPGVGDGDGDTDEDGERDIDCNPLSNPDCAFQSSAGGSNSCDATPTCSNADPVQCAILYQTWASMCYGDDPDITGAYDCNAPFSCDGNQVDCAAVKLQRDQYCDLYEAENWDYDVTDDTNFDLDLKTQASETDVSNMIDDSGFASGTTCPAPVDVTVPGGTVQVSFASMCSLASTLRPLLIIAAMFIGYMIIGGKK